MHNGHQHTSRGSARHTIASRTTRPAEIIMPGTHPIHRQAANRLERGGKHFAATDKDPPAAPDPHRATLRTRRGGRKECSADVKECSASAKECSSGAHEFSAGAKESSAGGKEFSGSAKESSASAAEFSGSANESSPREKESLASAKEWSAGGKEGTGSPKREIRRVGRKMNHGSRGWHGSRRRRARASEGGTRDGWREGAGERREEALWTYGVFPPLSCIGAAGWPHKATVF
jgi:hypothetical protein